MNKQINTNTQQGVFKVKLNGVTSAEWVKQELARALKQELGINTLDAFKLVEVTALNNGAVNTHSEGLKCYDCRYKDNCPHNLNSDKGFKEINKIIESEGDK